MHGGTRFFSFLLNKQQWNIRLLHIGDDYEFFAGRHLVTLFSAPHYCGQFDNAAAVMNVSDDFVCSFQVLRPTLRSKRIVPRARKMAKKM
jgi:hypothetical protein